MSEVNELLNRIWSEYNRAGIVDDFAIILRIAELLLLDEDQRLPDALRFAGLDRVLEFAHLDRRNQELGFGFESLQNALAEAAEKAGGKAQLFDRYVLFRLTDRLPGARFPTPRHIVETMQRLVQIGPEDTLADLACGSGGFLVSQDINMIRPKNIFGVDISPEWAALARVNTILHNEVNADIAVGNALRVCGSRRYRDRVDTFDRVLMAPPFGLIVEPRLTEDAIGLNIGSSSETALTALAIDRLAEGGRAAVLVPSGLLFRNGAGEKWLRKYLIDTCTLEAIITLPKDALQPFSSLQANLLLASKRPHGSFSHQNQTWFFQTEFDGYPVGRGRDLTEPPNGQNDLPFVEAVILDRGKPFTETFPNDETALVGIRKSYLHNRLLGLTIQALNNTQLSRVERFNSKDQQPISFLVVEVVDQDTRNIIRVHIKLSENGDAYEEKRSQKELSDEYNSWLLFEGHEAGQAIAIYEGSRLLGVTASTKTQIEKSYDLRPDQYMRVQDVHQAEVPPTRIIERIKANQSSFLQRLDWLALRIEAIDTFLQVQPAQVQEDIKPLAGLSVRQQLIWDRILELTRADPTASFSVQKLQNLTPTLQRKELTQTLDLLEYMGAIVPVTKIDQKTLLAEETDYYTLVTTRDKWIWES